MMKAPAPAPERAPSSFVIVDAACPPRSSDERRSPGRALLLLSALLVLPPGLLR